MTHIRFTEKLTRFVTCTFKSSRLVTLAAIAMFTCAAMNPAQAQSSDTWKSVAIIGGSTAAGAYIGHKVAGPTGAVVGAGLGASAGYAIDRRRRANQYYNQSEYGYNGDSGYYGNNGPYYPNDGYYGGGYYGGAADPGGYSYPSGYQNGNYYRSSNRMYGRR